MNIAQGDHYLRDIFKNYILRLVSPEFPLPGSCAYVPCCSRQTKNCCLSIYESTMSSLQSCALPKLEIHAQQRSVFKSQEKLKKINWQSERVTQKFFLTDVDLHKVFCLLFVCLALHALLAVDSFRMFQRELLITVLGIQFILSFTHNKFTENIFLLLCVVESDKFMRHETFCAV